MAKGQQKRCYHLKWAGCERTQGGQEVENVDCICRFSMVVMESSLPQPPVRKAACTHIVPVLSLMAKSVSTYGTRRCIWYRIRGIGPKRQSRFWTPGTVTEAQRTKLIVSQHPTQALRFCHYDVAHLINRQNGQNCAAYPRRVRSAGLAGAAADPATGVQTGGSLGRQRCRHQSCSSSAVETFFWRT